MGRLCFDVAFCILVFLFVAIYIVDGSSSSSNSGSSSTRRSHNQKVRHPDTTITKGRGSSSSSSSGKKQPRHSKPCDDHPCQHGGRCLNKGETYECVCTSGCSGRQCEKEPDPCANHPCQHGGICSAYRSGYRCRCPSAYTGIRCQNVRHPDTTITKGRGSSSSSSSGKKQPHHSKSSSSESNERRGHFTSPCDHNQCKRGQCIEFGKTFKCRCPSGFKGRRCQYKKKPHNSHTHGSKSSGSSSSAEIPVPRPCVPNPCWHGGTCLPQGNPYTCRCLAGYAGRRCEIAPKPSPCEIDPCSGNGKCYPKRDGGYRCECDPNYGGSRCNRAIQINPCDKNPCKNGGSCLPRGTNYQCHCIYPYEGINCKQVRRGPCDWSPCANGGMCFPEGSDFICQCSKRFEGKRCERAIAIGPCESEPCFNSGTCVPLRTAFECQCKPGYTGKRCENSPHVNDHVILETTNGEMENVDIPLMAFYTHSSYLLRFSVMCYDSVRIGFKSAVYSHVYYYVYFGKTSARIEYCENKCKAVAEADMSGTLSATAFTNFYIRFTSTGSLIVGLLDASFTELMSFNNEPPSCPLLVFVSSGDGYVATWKIYEAITEQVNTITWRLVNVNLRTDHYVYLDESIKNYDRQIRVGLAIDSEVSILLSKEHDDVNAYEIVFRAKENTKLLIKKHNKVVKEADCVVNSSSRDDFEDFWISFSDKTISVGRAGLDMKPAFVSWSDSSRLNIALTAFKGSPSSYLVYYKFEYQTARGIFSTFDCDMAYPLPFKRIDLPKHGFEFGLTANCDAHLSVSPADEDSPTANMYELVIGAADNSKCLIRKCKECESLAEADCPHILDKNKEVQFTFEFEFGHLKLFKGKGSTKSSKPIMSCEDPDPLTNLHYLALSTGFRSDGVSHWKTFNV